MQFYALIVLEKARSGLNNNARSLSIRAGGVRNDKNDPIHLLHLQQVHRSATIENGREWARHSRRMLRGGHAIANRVDSTRCNKAVAQNG